MKKALFLFVFLPILSSGQINQTNQSKSKLETFSLKTGNLYKKEYVDIGTTRKIVVEVLKITDILNKITVSGIRLQASVDKTYGSSLISCFLDADEIESFLKSSNFLLQTLNDSPENYTEYQFISRGGFRARAFCSKNNKEWKYFIQLDQYDKDTEIFFNKDDFEDLVNVITKAKPKL